MGSDAATQGSTRRWGVEVCGGQRWFKFWTILRVTGYFILRYWAYLEIWVRMGVEAYLYIILTSFLCCSCCLLCSILLLLVVIFICRQNSVHWIVFQECLRHVIVEKECWSDLPLSWSWWRQNTRVCDKEGCVGLDLTQREVLLFQGNILLLSFPAFSLLTSCWIIFLL